MCVPASNCTQYQEDSQDLGISNVLSIVIITGDLLGFLPVNSMDYDQIEKGLQDQICVDLTTTEEEEKVCCRTDEGEEETSGGTRLTDLTALAANGDLDTGSIYSCSSA